MLPCNFLKPQSQMSYFQGLKIRKQRSTGDLDRKGVMNSIRSTGSTSSWMSSESNYAGVSVMSEGSQASFVVEVSYFILIQEMS